MHRIFALILLFMIACKEDMQKELRTSAYSRADSLFNANLQSINQESDSLCIKFKTENLQGVIDSILDVRRKQIQQLRSLE